MVSIATFRYTHWVIRVRTAGAVSSKKSEVRNTKFEVLLKHSRPPRREERAGSSAENAPFYSTDKTGRYASDSADESKITLCCFVASTLFAAGWGLFVYRYYLLKKRKMGTSTLKVSIARMERASRSTLPLPFPMVVPVTNLRTLGPSCTPKPSVRGDFGKLYIT